MYYIVISLIDDSGEILCLCLRVWFVIVVLFSFCVNPETLVCGNGAGRHVYMFSVLSSLGSLVISGMCFAVDPF